MLSAAMDGCLETSFPSSDLTISDVISFYAAFLLQGFAPWGGGKSRQCLHCCHQTGSLMEEDMRKLQR